MRVVVADTGPLHYLLLVDQIALLPALFGTVTVPTIVSAELCHRSAPAIVRTWATSPPNWLTAVTAPPDDHPAFGALDVGEKAALALALSLRADLVLMDDRAGVAVARGKGFAVVGTIGIVDLAASRGLIDIANVVARLKATNFRHPPRLLDQLVSRYQAI